MRIASSVYPKNPLVVLQDGRKVRTLGNGLGALFLPWPGKKMKRYLTPTSYALAPGKHNIKGAK
jgi:hypothetical protein